MYRARKPVLEVYDQWKLLVQQHAEFQVELLRKKISTCLCFHVFVEKIDISCTFS